VYSSCDARHEQHVSASCRSRLLASRPRSLRRSSRPPRTVGASTSASAARAGTTSFCGDTATCPTAFCFTRKWSEICRGKEVFIFSTVILLSSVTNSLPSLCEGKTRWEAGTPATHLVRPKLFPSQSAGTSRATSAHGHMLDIESCQNKRAHAATHTSNPLPVRATSCPLTPRRHTATPHTSWSMTWSTAQTSAFTI